jgi:lysozyme
MIERLKTFFIGAKRFEGCRLIPYRCPAGRWTCGWGSTGPDVFPGRAWSQAYADQRLEQDALRFAFGVLVACPELATESDDRLSAVTDWAYNLGLGAFRASTFLRRLRELDWAAAARECRRWSNAAGRKLLGLVLRREWEAQILETGQCPLSFQ